MNMGVVIPAFAAMLGKMDPHPYRDAGRTGRRDETWEPDR